MQNKYQNVIMAYLDILGFKAILEKSKSNFNEVLNLIQKFDKIEKKSSNLLSLNSKVFEIKIVSDTIVVYLNVEEESNITAFLHYVGRLVMFTHTDDKEPPVFLRGSIAVGPHYSDIKYWISPVFVYAYKEEQDAKYPRILIHKSVFDFYKTNYQNDLTTLVRQDSDGKQILDYLSAGEGRIKRGTDNSLITEICMYTIPKDINKYLSMTHNQLFKDHKYRIEKFKEDYGNDSNLIEKINYLIIYHNQYIEFTKKYLEEQNRDHDFLKTYEDEFKIKQMDQNLLYNLFKIFSLKRLFYYLKYQLLR